MWVEVEDLLSAAAIHTFKAFFFCLRGNKLLNKMGLSLLGNIVGDGCHKRPVPKQAMRNNFRDVLQRFVRHMSQDEDLEENEEECLVKLGADCAAYLNTEAHDSSSYTQVVSTLTDVIKKFGIPQVESTFQLCDSGNVVLNLHNGFFQRWVKVAL